MKIAVGLGIIVLLVLFFLPIGGFVFARREKDVAGRVLDCETNQPIANALVSTNQSGWGVSNGNLIWDKKYSTHTQSASTGEYQLSYNVGSIGVKLEAEKEGYRVAEQQQKPNKNIVIKMLKIKNPGSLKIEDTEPTIHCTPISQCVVCGIENGVETCRNKCEELVD